MSNESLDQPSTENVTTDGSKVTTDVSKWTTLQVLPLLIGILLKRHSKADVAAKIGKSVDEVEKLLRQHLGELMLQLSRIHVLANSVRTALDKGIENPKKLEAYVDVCSDDIKSVVDALETIANPV